MKTSLGPKPIVFPMPAFLVATYDENGRPNVMTAAWGGIASSDPPCVSVSVRPSRWTHGAILKNKAFSVNCPSSALAVAVDYVGLVSGRDFDKFKIAGLTAVRSDLVEAPYVAECPVTLECALRSQVDLGAHTMFVGQIVDVKADTRTISLSAEPDPVAIDPLIFASGAYHQLGQALGRAFSIGLSLKKNEPQQDRT
ncbi:MAG: flavin reductase family protein [Deltaproteobacteria bacterium]|jgi:flavin reductase (DIM6/NTAB) family NADH-FMN oxidoreductase RutF|nr:flavin reductase family protein [Deltaproteobacteria bacterium]